MKRLHLFEIHDQDWCARTIRDAETDYLQFVVAKTNPYAAMIPVLATALGRAGARQVLDLCSGAGGPWPWLRQALAERGVHVSVCLTDKYPHLNALEPMHHLADPAIRYHPQPVDARRVSSELVGFRTMFSSFHHFRPEEARAILLDAVRKHEGIAIFEGTQRTALAMLLMLLVPLMVLLTTPFIRPFRWSRLLWTYVIPLVPLVSLFDGLVSCLRTYSVQELRELTEGLHENNYRWEAAELKITAGPIPITYLLGVPIEPVRT
jgi:hypothetical protein